MSVGESVPTQKSLGAFYTPEAMAERMVRWAVREPEDRVLDPSAGEVVFLRQTVERLERLGASSSAAHAALFGAEIDERAHAVATQNLGLHTDQLVLSDFFDLDPGVDLPLVSAVVGNPPYVRYHGFNRASSRGHERARDAGVALPKLASSWAPFLVHAVSFVAEGGRMAQVLPAELVHAAYADDIMNFLCSSFGRVVLVTFEERVFPGALQEIVILLADHRGKTTQDIEHHDFTNLLEFAPDRLGSGSASPMRPDRRGRRDKLLFRLLSDAAQSVYSTLADDERVTTFGEVASVDIGVVTGNNRFFLRSEGEAADLDPALLRTTLSKATHVAGAVITSDDVAALRKRDAKIHLLAADATTPEKVLSTADALLKQGSDDGVPEGYKCRIRSPWWAVPGTSRPAPDLVLTYCSNVVPRLAANDAAILTTNTLHQVRLHRDSPSPHVLAAGFYNSFTLLSAELVGRSYGGGVLKLEPSEAEAVLLPPIPPRTAEALAEVDEFLRAGRVLDLQAVVDEIVLQDGLGLGQDEVLALREGVARLRSRRQGRSAKPR